MNNGLAKTPPMGWNSWNRFGPFISEDLIKETAHAIVNSGMRNAGYEYVVIDDAWQLEDRDPKTKKLVPNPQTFPHGIRHLSEYIHNLGLKFGIYTCAGNYTCEHKAGSYGHEDRVAETFADWGVDYVKIDWCHSQGMDAQERYKKMSGAIQRSGKPIIISLCEWGENTPWEWANRYAHLWRTTGDIKDSWDIVTSNLDKNARLHSWAAPGGWNDPDMLEVGNGGMTDTEYRSHFSLWAMMAAPLMAGNDLMNMDDKTRKILMNTEIIAINQDRLGVQGKIIQKNNGLSVWRKPLIVPGSYAIALFNRTNQPSAISVEWEQLGSKSRYVKVRDLWEKQDLGVVKDGYSAEVPPHGIKMLKVNCNP